MAKKQSRDEAVDTLRSVAEEQCGALRAAAMAIEAEIASYPETSQEFWNRYVKLMRDASVELHQAAFAVQRASTKKWRTFAGALVIAVTTGAAEGATGVIGETFFEPGTPAAESLGAAAVVLEKPTETMPESSDGETVPALAELEELFSRQYDTRVRPVASSPDYSDLLVRTNLRRVAKWVRHDSPTWTPSLFDAVKVAESQVVSTVGLEVDLDWWDHLVSVVDRFEGDA